MIILKINGILDSMKHGICQVPLAMCLDYKLPSSATHKNTHFSLEKKFSDNKEFERKIYKLHTIHFTKEEYELV